MKSIITSLFTIITIHICQAQYVDFEWATSFADTCTTSRAAMCVDNSGNVIVGGDFISSGDFDPGIGLTRLVSNGKMDGYITKLDTNGSHLWSISFGAEENDHVSEVTVDGNSNIYITGYFQDTVDFDPGPGVINKVSNGEWDVFILKLSPSGNFIWVRTIGGKQEDQGVSIKVDSFGDIVVGGDFIDSMDVDPGINISNLYNFGWGPFILKINPSGNFIWAKTFQGAGAELLRSMSLDKFGSIYCTGIFDAAVDFDPGPSTLSITPAWRDIFVVKIDKQGNLDWVVNINITSGFSEPRDIGVNGNGDVLITGLFSNTVDFDPGLSAFNLTTNGSAEDVFILNLDSSGNFGWAKSIGGNATDQGISLTFNSQNDLLLAGSIGSSSDLDPGPGIYNSGIITGETTFILKLKQNGDFNWARIFEGSYISEVDEIFTDNNDDIFVSGDYQGTFDFDPSAGKFNLSAYRYDIFVVKLSEGNCSNLRIKYDSTSSINCSQAAYVEVNAFGGNAPYSYSWNSAPAVNDSIFMTTQGGFYTVTASDSTCTATSTIFIDGPNIAPGFDLEVNMSTEIFRPGQSCNVWLDAFNLHCDSVDGELWLIHDPKLKFNNSTIPPGSVTNDTLKWNFTNLNYSSPHIGPQINFTTDTSARIGDTLCILSIIHPISGDLDSLNNTKEICLPVINSFDPNDKQVYPQGKCIENYTLHDTPLTYTVRFQNTGNASALDVYIIDTLSQFLDLNSLRVISSSHHMYTEVLPGNALKFVFNNINLPDSLTNPNGSQGYVIFKLSPLANLSNGTEIKNTAQIYFDFNEPIVTNTTLNTMVAEIPKCLTAIMENPLKRDKLLIYPNPVNSTLYFFGKDKIERIELTDITGKVRLIENGSIDSIDVRELESGIYLLRIKTEGKWEFAKFIKE